MKPAVAALAVAAMLLTPACDRQRAAQWLHRRAERRAAAQRAGSADAKGSRPPARKSAPPTPKSTPAPAPAAAPAGSPPPKPVPPSPPASSRPATSAPRAAAAPPAPPRPDGNAPPFPAPRPPAAARSAARRPPPVDFRPLEIPASHLPAPGECRVWIPGRPSEEQPEAGACSDLRHELPAGAWLLHRPASQPDRVRVSVSDSRRPGLVVVVRLYEAETGKFIKEELP